jgi:ribonuclease BN (tRNA processing enzyme)
LKLVCIGKYGPFPKAGEGCSGYLLSHEGQNAVLDMGCGTLSKLLLKLRVQDIDAVVLSHLHADHMGDVLTLRYALEVAKKLGWRSAPLRVYLPAEPTAEAEMITSHPLIDARIITDGMRANICGMNVRFALMPHSVPSYAMAFEAGGRKFVYSGDTRDNENIIKFAENADLLLMEAALLSKDMTPAAQHISARDAGRIARDAGVKRLLITHIFPEYDPDDLLREARECFHAAEVIEENQSYEV